MALTRSPHVRYDGNDWDLSIVESWHRLWIWLAELDESPGEGWSCSFRVILLVNINMKLVKILYLLVTWTFLWDSWSIFRDSSGVWCFFFFFFSKCIDVFIGISLTNEHCHMIHPSIYPSLHPSDGTLCNKQPTITNKNRKKCNTKEPPLRLRVGIRQHKTKQKPKWK